MITDTDRLDWMLRHGAELVDDGQFIGFVFHRSGQLPEWKRRKAEKLIDMRIEQERSR